MCSFEIYRYRFIVIFSQDKFQRQFRGSTRWTSTEWILIESALFAEISRSSIHSHDLPTCSGLCIHPHGVQEAAPMCSSLDLYLSCRRAAILRNWHRDSFFYSRFLLFSALYRRRCRRRRHRLSSIRAR